MGSKKKQSANNIPQKEKDNMIEFFVQNFREHVSMSSLSKKYAEVRDTGIPSETYRHRFSTHLVPNIHKIDCSVKTKLEMYQKFRIKVNVEYIEEITKQANIKLDKEGIIVDFKMKDEPDDEDDDYDSDDNVASVRVTEKQKKHLWKFVVANYKKYNKNQLLVEYAAFQGGKRLASTYRKRFDKHLAPHIHLPNGSFKVKLDICREYKVRLSEESLKELAKHADITFKKGMIVGFKMKEDLEEVEEPNVDDSVDVDSAERVSAEPGDEMNDGDAEEKMSTIRKQISQKEKDDMAVFLVQHFREHVGMNSLSKQYAEVQGTGIPSETYRCRFRVHLVPNIHEIDCSVKTKLEIYQKYQIKVNEEYIEELKKHADVTLKEGVVVEFKMKDDNEEVEGLDNDGSVDGQMAGGTPEHEQDVDDSVQVEPMDVDSAERESGDEMDEEDAEEVKSDAPHRFDQKEKDNMIAFLVQHFREHVSMSSLCRKYAEVRDAGIPFETYRYRFTRYLAQDFHQIDCSVETKLEMYQKFHIKVNKEYIEELKRHADITFKKGVVVGFKMKEDSEEVEEPIVDDSVDGQMAGGTPEYQQDVVGPDHFEPMETDSVERELNGVESGVAVDQQFGDVINYEPIGDNGGQIVRNDEQRDDYDSDLDLPILQNQNDQPNVVEEHVEDVSMDIDIPKLGRNADRPLEHEAQLQNANRTDVAGLEDLRNNCNQEQMNKMWKYLIENFREYKVSYLLKRYAKVQAETPYHTLIKWYYERLIPNIHMFDCPIETKLEICQKYNIKIHDEYIGELKRHADIVLNLKGVVLEFKMKAKPVAVREPDADDAAEGQGSSTRPKRNARHSLNRKEWIVGFKVKGQLDEEPKPKRKRGRPSKAGSEKKPKRRRERDAVKPGSKKKDESVKGQIAGPVSQKRSRPQKASPEKNAINGRRLEEEDEEDDEVIVDAVKPGTGISNPDMIIVVPKEEDLVDDGRNFVMDQGYYYQGDDGMEQRLMAEMWSMMHGMTNTMNAAEERMNENVKKQMTNLQGAMKKEIDSLKKENKTLAKTVASLQKTTSPSFRPHESGDVNTVPNKKECLLKLKDFVHLLNSPEIEEIKQRIDTAIQHLPEDNEDPVPTTQIAKTIDSILRSMNQ